MDPAHEPSIFGDSQPPEPDPLITTAQEHAEGVHPFWGGPYTERRAGHGQRGSRSHHRAVGTVEQPESGPEGDALPTYAPI